MNCMKGPGDGLGGRYGDEKVYRCWVLETRVKYEGTQEGMRRGEQTGEERFKRG